MNAAVPVVPPTKEELLQLLDEAEYGVQTSEEENAAREGGLRHYQNLQAKRPRFQQEVNEALDIVFGRGGIANEVHKLFSKHELNGSVRTKEQRTELIRLLEQKSRSVARSSQSSLFKRALNTSLITPVREWIQRLEQLDLPSQHQKNATTSNATSAIVELQSPEQVLQSAKQNLALYCKEVMLITHDDENLLHTSAVPILDVQENISQTHWHFISSVFREYDIAAELVLANTTRDNFTTAPARIVEVFKNRLTEMVTTEMPLIAQEHAETLQIWLRQTVECLEREIAHTESTIDQFSDYDSLQQTPLEVFLPATAMRMQDPNDAAPRCTHKDLLLLRKIQEQKHKQCTADIGSEEIQERCLQLNTANHGAIVDDVFTPYIRYQDVEYALLQLHDADTEPECILDDADYNMLEQLVRDQLLDIGEAMVSLEECGTLAAKINQKHGILPTDTIARQTSAVEVQEIVDMYESEMQSPMVQLREYCLRISTQFTEVIFTAIIEALEAKCNNDSLTILGPDTFELQWIGMVQSSIHIDLIAQMKTSKLLTIDEVQQWLATQNGSLVLRMATVVKEVLHVAEYPDSYLNNVTFNFDIVQYDQVTTEDEHPTDLRTIEHTVGNKLLGQTILGRPEDETSYDLLPIERTVIAEEVQRKFKNSKLLGKTYQQIITELEVGKRLCTAIAQVSNFTAHGGAPYRTANGAIVQAVLAEARKYPIATDEFSEPEIAYIHTELTAANGYNRRTLRRKLVNALKSQFSVTRSNNKIEAFAVAQWRLIESGQIHVAEVPTAEPIPTSSWGTIKTDAPVEHVEEGCKDSTILDAIPLIIKQVTPYVRVRDSLQRKKIINTLFDSAKNTLPSSSATWFNIRNFTNLVTAVMECALVYNDTTVDPNTESQVLISNWLTLIRRELYNDGDIHNQHSLEKALELQYKALVQKSADFCLTSFIIKRHNWSDPALKKPTQQSAAKAAYSFDVSQLTVQPVQVVVEPEVVEEPEEVIVVDEQPIAEPELASEPGPIAESAVEPEVVIEPMAEEEPVIAEALEITTEPEAEKLPLHVDQLFEDEPTVTEEPVVEEPVIAEVQEVTEVQPLQPSAQPTLLPAQVDFTDSTSGIAGAINFTQIPGKPIGVHIQFELPTTTLQLGGEVPTLAPRPTEWSQKILARMREFADLVPKAADLVKMMQDLTQLQSRTNELLERVKMQIETLGQLFTGIDDADNAKKLGFVRTLLEHEESLRGMESFKNEVDTWLQQIEKKMEDRDRVEQYLDGELATIAQGLPVHEVLCVPQTSVPQVDISEELEISLSNLQDTIGGIKDQLHIAQQFNTADARATMMHRYSDQYSVVAEALGVPSNAVKPLVQSLLLLTAVEAGNHSGYTLKRLLSSLHGVFNASEYAARRSVSGESELQASLLNQDLFANLLEQSHVSEAAQEALKIYRHGNCNTEKEARMECEKQGIKGEVISTNSATRGILQTSDKILYVGLNSHRSLVFYPTMYGRSVLSEYNITLTDEQKATLQDL